jgi:DnaK suppressor protein
MEELTDKQLSSFRQSLMTIRDDLHLVLEISEASGETVVLDQSKVGRLSRVDALQQQQMSNACRIGYRKRLLAVEHALSAMDQGDYGWCESCGELIDIRRLDVRPESSLCVVCQEKSEE